MPNRLTLRHKRILACIQGCLDMGLSPSDAGLLECLHGEGPLEEHPLFGCNVSISSRNLKTQLRNLLSEGYLRREEAEGESYLFLTPLGEREAIDYLSKPHARVITPNKKKKYLRIERK